MKKLMTALAVCAAATISMAQSVPSANVVGYSTVPVKATDYTMLGINFQAVGGNDVAINSYFQGNFAGGPDQPDADTLITWSLASGYKAYFYCQGVDPSLDNNWLDLSYNIATNTLPVGSACWLLRRGPATNLVFSGQVKTTVTATTIKANDYTMFSNPYPTLLPINGGINVVSPTGGPDQPDADTLIGWSLASGYKAYFYCQGVDPSLDNNWLDLGYSITTDTINIGGAAWYLRRGSQTTMSFTSPLQ